MYGNSVASRDFYPAAMESVFPSYYNDGAVFVSKKRPREETMTIADHSGDFIYVPNREVSGWYGTAVDPESDYCCHGNDGSIPMMQQPFEIDHLVFRHMERVKIEMEEHRRNQLNRMIRTIDQAVSKKMRAKEDQIQKMRKLNVGLQEHVKSLNLENQLWRDLAQSNEATANALRANLDQLIAQHNSDNTADGELDAESCCGSNEHVANDAFDEVVYDKMTMTGGVDQSLTRMCRRCQRVECSVLVLPCRHLCLCLACESTVDVCPICNSIRSASVHVNFF